MHDVESLADLFEHLERTAGLARADAVRVLDEMLTYFSETLPEFVARRHVELQGESLKNAEIFDRIVSELGVRRFRAPSLTHRQIRRIVYG